MIYDGCSVEYTGQETDSLVPGNQGSVLVVSGHSAHVQWKTGGMAGQVTLQDSDDLSPSRGRHEAVEASLDDSLEVSGLGTFTARQIYDEGGSGALLNAMADSGKLSSFRDIAEEALALIAGRIRTSASFTALASHLDEDEADEMVRLAAATLIRDAFSTS